MEQFKKPERKTKAFLGLGANIGDRGKNLTHALELLASLEGVKILNKSSVYSTPPYGVIDQPFFYNRAVEIETSLMAEELLKKLKKIESDMGRNSHEQRWGPRVIDIDILLFGDRGEEIVFDDGINIPHYDLHNRAFFLLPLAEIDSRIEHPVIKRTIENMLAHLDKTEVNSCHRLKEV